MELCIFLEVAFAPIFDFGSWYGIVVTRRVQQLCLSLPRFRQGILGLKCDPPFSRTWSCKNLNDKPLLQIVYSQQNHVRTWRWKSVFFTARRIVFLSCTPRSTFASNLGLFTSKTLYKSIAPSIRSNLAIFATQVPWNILLWLLCCYHSWLWMRLLLWTPPGRLSILVYQFLAGPSRQADVESQRPTKKRIWTELVKSFAIMQSKQGQVLTKLRKSHRKPLVWQCSKGRKKWLLLPKPLQKKLNHQRNVPFSDASWGNFVIRPIIGIVPGTGSCWDGWKEGMGTHLLLSWMHLLHRLTSRWDSLSLQSHMMEGRQLAAMRLLRYVENRLIKTAIL